MNSLFIGLGGAGTNALGELQKKFEDYDLASGTHSLNNYLYVDTDLAIRNKYPFIDANGDYLQIGAGEVPSHIMDLAFSPNNAGNPDHIRFKEWIDKNNPSLRANHDFTTGAAGERMLTRMITWNQYGKIKGQLNEKLTLRNNAPVERIYVVSGTCGGTGCGCLIDVLYMLREIQIQNNMVNNFPKVNLMLVMPQGYIEVYPKEDGRYRNYILNAYGLLTEINAVLKDRWANVKYKTNAQGQYLDKNGNVTTSKDEYVEEPNPVIGKQWAKHSVKPSSKSVVDKLHFEPFDQAYFFDSHNFDVAAPYEYGTVSERIAEFVFNLEVGNTVRAGLDTVFSNVLVGNRIDSARAAYIKAFCSTGTFTIQTHEELRKRYVQERFVYQMMAHGFMGKDTDYPAPLTPDVKLWESLNGSITDYINASWQIVEGLYQDDDRNAIYELLQNIEKASKEKTPSFARVFTRLDNRNQLQINYSRLCAALRETVFAKCGEWIVRYNFEYAKAKIDYEDLNSTRVYNDDIVAIKGLVPKFVKKAMSSKRTMMLKLKDAFTKYINVLANRFLSEDGCFDECRTILDDVTNAINFDEFEIKPKRKLVKWDLYFVKDVMNLKNDPTRKFIPDVSTLIAGAGLSGRCDFPSKYAGIVTQVEGTNIPDMDLTLEASGLMIARENTLPWYKEKILNEINRDIVDFTEQFRPDVLKEGNPMYVFETFLNYAKQEARTIVHNPDNNLSEPIADKLKVSTVLTDTALDLYNAKSTYLSSNNDGTLHPLRAIYLGHFTGAIGTQLEQAIRGQNGFNQAEHTIQDDPAQYWSDRYVKVLAKMNYDINDYAFFSQYKTFFEDYYTDHKSDWSRHMPFSSVQFWNCDNADIVNLFNKGAEDTMIEQLRDSLVWNDKEQVYAFGFMAILLNEFYETLSKLPGSKKFIKKFQSKTKGKTTVKPLSREKNNVTMTYSSDFIHNPLLEKYFVDDEDGVQKMNLATKINKKFVGDVKDIYNRYVRFWITVITKALSQQTVSDEDTLYNNAYQVIYDIAKKGGDQELFANLMAPYFDAQNGTKGQRNFFEEYLLWFSK